MSQAKERDADQFHAGLLHPRYWPTWLGVGVIGLFTCLPASWRRKVLAPIGRKAIFSSKGRLRAVKTNINLCFPELSADQKQAMLMAHAEYAGFALGELAWPWFRSLKRTKRRTRVEGLEKLRAAQAPERPIILLLPHMLFLDYAVMSITHEIPCAGIFNTFKNPVIDWLVALRRGGAARYSATLHPDTSIDNSLSLIRRQSGSTIQQIISRAKKGFAVIHLMDEDLGGKNAVFAPLFGHQKATLGNMSTILKRTDALVVPLTVVYETSSDQYVLHLDDAMDLRDCVSDRVAVSTAINQAYEKMILRAPEQYMWNLRIFRNRPEGDERVFYKNDVDWH